MKKNYFKSLMQAAVLVCTPLVIASCDDVFGDTDNPIPAYMSIKQSDINLVLHADKKDSATATRTAIAATGAEVVYSSSNEKVATVDAKTGVITAVGGGKCEIIAEVTGKDSNGRNTYQPQKSSFTVNVTDWRARIALKEGAVVPVYNSALNVSQEKIDLKELLDVWPVLGTTDLEIYNDGKDPDGVIAGVSTDGKISLTGKVGVAKVVAKFQKIPAKFEKKSFPKAQESDTLIVEVKKGVAYVSGYDAKGGPVTKYMFKDYNGEKYTNLSEVLYDDKNIPIDNDVALAAGWYYVDKYISDFKHNIRIKGDVNFILGDGKALDMAGLKSIMDESANKAYKLNFFPETKAASGWVRSSKIQDFKEVNVLGVTVKAPVDKVANVTINKGSITGSLTGTGNVNITNGSAGDITGFATVTLAKGTANVGNLKTIGSAILSEGTSAKDLTDVTTITIDKASIWNIQATTTKKPIASATITNANIGYVNGVTTLTLNETKATGQLWNITTLNVNKGSEVGVEGVATDYLNAIETINMADGSKVWSDNATVNALNINGGDMVVRKQIYGFDAKYNQAAGKVTMTGGTLTVGKSLTATNKKAVIADVEVTKGDFTAESNYHAVEGALIGTFYGSTDKTTWTKIENEDRPKYITTIEPKTKK